MEDFWADNDYFTGPKATELMIRRAEKALGFTLPSSYTALIQSRNGGAPKRTYFPTDAPTAWAPDHIAVSGIRGVGGKWGIDALGLGSRAMIAEWGYPEIGILVGECPSAGHDAVMLDYSQCGPRGEPRVVHVDVESNRPVVTVLAKDFSEFLLGLRDEAEFTAGA